MRRRRTLWLAITLVLASGVLALAFRENPEAAEALKTAVVRSTTTTTEPPTTTTSAPPETTTSTTAAPKPPARALDPDAVAAQIVETETALRDPATPEANHAALGHNQQLAYKQIVEHPEWLDVVLTKVPQPLHDAVRANVKAGQELRALAPKTMRKLPTGWRIVTPAPAAELLAYYKEAEAEFKVPWSYLAAIHLVETRMGRIRGTSSAGAQGPMQFMPATWARFGKGDINSNRDAILSAARYLVYNGAPTRMRDALWNYNHSFHYVDAVTLYAEQMRANELAFRGYYHWQVYYRTVDGDHHLPEGWTGA